jgi:cytochrome oxidase assembly protein ShyY1
MSRRIPIVPTIVVALAVATMIALGFWQLDRARERDAIRAATIARATMPPIELPYSHPADERLLYRHVAATCARVTGWETRGGESVKGGTGWRQIATCVGGSGGARFQVDMGVARLPEPAPAWAGGTVTGVAIRAPDARGVLDRLGGRKVVRPMMIVSDKPAAGLAASKQPDPRDATNSSWSYAGQWFLFALTALVIYVLAVRKRWRATG